MNVFVLDRDPRKAAKMLCDKHVIKMCLETAQILSTAVLAQLESLPIVKQAAAGSLYRATHAKHPCVIWAGASRTNFDWLLEHGKAIADEYTFRYGKLHKSQAVIEAAEDHKHWLRPGPATAFPLAMPDQYKTADCEQSYRAYYLGEKMHFAKWTKRATPEWTKP